ncbi:hypothetical protein K469DRAFT_546042 [Zopfia rhizophila CBS 207.26]|uniref:Uncharacterized protein n=1 Tax=Zopfia rhizophila CBS 207.26 TaxID=1314779 RepID=A0A6A6EWH5_9PEZI|nr:hypothetical protein K469DRAFT_546042 [Zopfia rhizophila CBS 207.26]
MALDMHKDHLSANELDLKDPYVLSSLGLYAIHNVIRRNLASCAEHAKQVNKSNMAPFLTYANYTLHVLKDQLESVDTIWFPKFATYDQRFTAQIEAHRPIIKEIEELERLLEVEAFAESTDIVSQSFGQLHKWVDSEFDTEEALTNQLGHLVPIGEIQELEKRQEERRLAQVKVYGHLWTAVYLLRGLGPKERAIFPPGIPKVVASGMLTAGALQFRKYVDL